MKEIERYDLTTTRNGTSTLVSNGTPLPRRISGVKLEAQYTLGARDLILTSQDACFDERLEIYLLEDMKVLDKAALASGWSSVAIAVDFIVESHNTVSFQFWDHRSCVIVHERKFFRGLGVDGPVKWWPRFWGYLDVQAVAAK